MATLYMMFGYPGAGKTTAAEAIEGLTEAVRLTSDQVRLELFPQPTFSQAEHKRLYEILDEGTEKLLSEGKDVIYDANLNRREHREAKYAICKRTGATPKLLWVQTARDLAKQRAVDKSRQQLWPNYETPNQMFDRIADVIEEPGPDEPYTAIDGTKVTPDNMRDLLQL